MAQPNMPGGERPPMTDHTITSVEQLEALYGRPGENSVVKEVGQLTAPYRAVVEAAPFFALATVGPEGLDCSPRGDAPGFVRVLDERRVAFPDRRGNNRADSLRNIVRDPRVALLFLVPGMAETLRINGRAAVSTEPSLLASFAVGDKAPRSVILVEIDSVYFQCSRALERSALWQPQTWPERAALPSAGAMLKACKADFDAEGYDAALQGRVAGTLY